MPGPGRRNPLSRRQQTRRPPLLQDLLEIAAAQAAASPSLRMMELHMRLVAQVMRLRRLAC